MENKWQRYICEVLDSKKQYVDTKKSIVIDGIPMVEKTVRTEDQVITWQENDKKEILNVNCKYSQ
jgi:hypothetical protein